jgi:hypothetical protein|tara:strand:- start:927 stop:1079 length:153 start_codon:yes stop_codon:yes gene_type:complete
MQAWGFLKIICFVVKEQEYSYTLIPSNFIVIAQVLKKRDEGNIPKKLGKN